MKLDFHNASIGLLLDFHNASICLLEIPTQWYTRKTNQAQPRPRKGDPLLPMLFILTIDPLQRILRKAATNQVIQLILTGNTQEAISMYADDAVIFVQPKHEELQALQ